MNLCVRHATNLMKQPFCWEWAVIRICLFAAAVAALTIGVGSPADARPGIARLAESYADGTTATATTTTTVKPDELRNAKPRKKPRMVLRCALFGRFIQGCTPTQ